MIDIEKCGNCDNIRPLLERGYDQATLQLIGRAGDNGAELSCARAPEIMDGGWQKCHANSLGAAALRGASVVLAMASVIDNQPTHV